MPRKEWSYERLAARMSDEKDIIKQTYTEQLYGNTYTHTFKWEVSGRVDNLTAQLVEHDINMDDGDAPSRAEAADKLLREYENMYEVSDEVGMALVRVEVI